MVKLSIDGHEIEVTEGTNIVEAAAKAGIEVPTYCYHPGLSVVGQCRICFVEVEGMPRLTTACSTPVRDEMVVFTNSERVQEARQAVMEFLLENHPLDCPVCDRAGECFLQDYSFEHGLDTTHMVDERRTYPGLERRLIGPHVVQNQNRCIHCTRCIRFTREISETGDLTMKSRGNRAYIDTFDGRPLDNPWSACVADVCPVGALTVREFRFRARVWHLDETESICPGCSIGCNIHVGHLKGIVYRFKPRENPEINGWWMCDHGRFLAEGLNARDLHTPQASSEKRLEPVGWPEAIERLAALVKEPGGLRVVASANLSNEALYLARRLFIDQIGARLVVPVDRGNPRRIKDGQGQWVDSADGHPNSLGARLIGLPTGDEAALRKLIHDASGPVVILDAEAHPWLQTRKAASALSGSPVAVFARSRSAITDAAGLVLPAASWIESEGTYTSSTGRVQLARRGMFPAGEARPVWEVLHLLAISLGTDEEPTATPRSVFEELAAEVPAFAGMTYGRLSGEPGVPVLEEAAHVG